MDQDRPTRNERGQYVPGSSGNPTGVRRDIHQDTRVENRSILAQFAQMPVPASRWDGWFNSNSGVGIAGVDKRIGGQFLTDFITHRDAMEMWLGDDIAARAIESVPAECFRQGYELVIDDERDYGDLKEEVESRIEELLLNDHLETVFQYERAYGGGALLLGAIDGQTMDQPLDLDKIQTFDWVTPLEPIELFPLYYYNDPMAPKYGMPLLYQLNTTAIGPTAPGERGTMPPNGTLIHESRLIVFRGIRVSKYQPFFGGVGPFWGTSMLTRLKSVLRDFSIGWASAGIIITDFSQGVLSVENLAALVGEKGPDVLSNRIRALELTRSIARVAMIDKNETYTRQTTSVAGLADLLDRLSSRLAAAIDMPLTLLMGQSPKGLGNEGDSDVRFYYDRIKKIQTRRLTRPLRRVIQLIMRSIDRKAEPKKWAIKYLPLWQLSDTETTQARFTQGQTDALMIANGVLTADEVRQSRYSGEYSYETQIDDDLVKAQDAGTAGQPDAAAMAAMGRTPGAAGAPAAPIEPSKTAMNGAQISSLMAVITAVNTKEISRESGIAVLVTAFQVSEEDAAGLLGPKGFVPAPNVPPPPVGFGGPTPSASGAPSAPGGAPKATDPGASKPPLGKPAPSGGENQAVAQGQRLQESAPAADKRRPASAGPSKTYDEASEHYDGSDDQARDKAGRWTRDPDSEGEKHSSHFFGATNPEDLPGSSKGSIHPVFDVSSPGTRGPGLRGYEAHVAGQKIGLAPGVKGAKAMVEKAIGVPEKATIAPAKIPAGFGAGHVTPIQVTSAQRAALITHVLEDVHENGDKVHLAGNKLAFANHVSPSEAHGLLTEAANSASEDPHNPDHASSRALAAVASKALRGGDRTLSAQERSTVNLSAPAKTDITTWQSANTTEHEAIRGKLREAGHESYASSRMELGRSSTIGEAHGATPEHVLAAAHAVGAKAQILEHTKPGETREPGKFSDKSAIALAARANEHGGFTFDPATGKYPTSGYAVSIHPGHEQVVRAEHLSAENVKSYLGQHGDFLKATPGAHVGAWFDKDAKKWYLDISHVTPDKEEATSLAKAHNQEGIYDLGQQQTILTKSADKRRIDDATTRHQEVLLRPTHDDRRGDGRGHEGTRGRGGRGREEGRVDDEEARDEQGRWTAGGNSSKDLSHNEVQAQKVSAALGKIAEHTKMGTLSGTPEEQLATARDALAGHAADLPGAIDRLTKVVGPQAEVGGRTKELHSALEKVARKATEASVRGAPLKYANASQLQDLTGMRVVVPTAEAQHAAVEAIRKNYKVVGEDDYTNKPQPGGYRAHHLIIEDQGRQKEVQVATERQRRFQKWSHDVYKPQTAAQISTKQGHLAELTRYAKETSDYLHDKDQGHTEGLTEPAPLSPAVAATFGRLRLDAKSVALLQE